MRFPKFWRREPAAAGENPVAPRRAPGRLRFAGAMLSDQGRVRSSNQDAVIYFTGVEEEGDTFDLVAAVADGMGGHAAGEVASEIALATLRKELKETRADPSLALAQALARANEAIREHARTHPETQGMGTTCTALFLRDDRCWIGHVGDSRAYLQRDGVLTQVSEDHTLRAQLLRDGTITADEAESAQMAGLLLRALGAADSVEPMLSSSGLPLQAEDRLLLCSDGLHGVVGDDRIRAALAFPEPQSSCEDLIQAANAAGGPDNVSVGVFRFYAAARPAGPGAPTVHDGLAAAPRE